MDKLMMNFMMKHVKISYSIVVAVCVVCTSCEKREMAAYYEPNGPVTVTVDKSTADVHVPFRFDFSGFADSVVFYSGKEGHQYEFRNRTEMDGLSHQLSFTSYRQWGTQENTLRLLVSRDFDGDNYSESGINAATWIDITDRAQLSSGANDAPSGAIDFTDLLGASGPVYFAYKFVGSAGTTQRTWTIKNFSIETVLPNGNMEEVATNGTAGWVGISLKNPDMKWSISSSQIQMVGGNETAAENEDWIISKGFSLNSVRPDQGEVIKARYQFMVKDYYAVYDEPGTYHAVIVAKSGAGDAQVEKVQEFELTVK